VIVFLTVFIIALTTDIVQYIIEDELISYFLWILLIKRQLINVYIGIHKKIIMDSSRYNKNFFTRDLIFQSQIKIEEII